jgi:hypothetical protein
VSLKVDVGVYPSHFDQCPTDDGKLRIKNPPESNGRECRWHDVGQQDDGPEKRFESERSLFNSKASQSPKENLRTLATVV